MILAILQRLCLTSGGVFGKGRSYGNNYGARLRSAHGNELLITDKVRLMDEARLRAVQIAGRNRRRDKRAPRPA